MTKFADAILANLSDRFTATNGDAIEGQTVSTLLTELRGRGFSFSDSVEFEERAERAGFAIMTARNSRNQRCRVVTL